MRLCAKLCGMDREIISQTVRAGKRTFFISVKKTNGGVPYLEIAESKFDSGGAMKSKVTVFPEYLDDFLKTLLEIAPKVKDPNGK